MELLRKLATFSKKFSENSKVFTFKKVGLNVCSLKHFLLSSFLMKSFRARSSGKLQTIE